VSRQFIEMNRLRVEGLLAAFPKLVGPNSKTQHTYVETDSVRYIYQPLENSLYLLLITTKASNIVEDLGTLRLLAKVVPDVCGGLQEHSISEHAFDLIFAFDEVLTAGGYKEEATLSSIRINLAMDSHEEKIQKALMDAKREEAKKRMNEEAQKIKERKLTQMKQNLMSGGTATTTMGGMEGFGGGGYGNQQHHGGVGGFMQGFDPNHQEQQQQEQTDYFSPYASLQPKEVNVAPKVLAKSGMKLGAGGIGGMSTKKDSLMAAMAAEDNLLPMAGGGGAAGAFKNAFDLSAPKPPAAVPSTPLSIALEEKITVQMNREGGVEACEVKGTLTLTPNTDVGTMALLAINKNTLPSNFSYATHPKLDKKAYETKGLLSLKGGKGFPINRPIGVLRWSYSGEDAAPLTINCWPEDEGTGTINVNIEMELTRTDLVLQDVNILLPLGTSDPPAVESSHDGVFKHDPASGMLCWHFDQVDKSNANGSMEFTIAGSNTDAFFPVHIGFRSETLLCPISITSVTHATNGTPIPNQISQSFSPDSYQCA
jgi:coatomer subunit delta